jgi:hypothetical protein
MSMGRILAQDLADGALPRRQARRAAAWLSGTRRVGKYLGVRGRRDRISVQMRRPAEDSLAHAPVALETVPPVSRHLPSRGTALGIAFH